MGFITKALSWEGLSTQCWKDISHKARFLRINTLRVKLESRALTDAK